MKRTVLPLVILLSIAFTGSSQTILGIDVSTYQGTVNWTSVKGAGYTFAWAKATEGLTVTDNQYVNNATNGVAAGMYMGAYHYAHPDVNGTNAGAVSEANYFLSVAGSYITNCELPPALDLEVSTSLTSAQLTSWVQTWMTTVKNATGITPILYTDGSIANSLGASMASFCNLWTADPDGSATATPSATYLGVWNPNWSFKQYSWTGTIPGISGNVDCDSYNGSLTGLKNLMVCTPPVCHTYYASLPYSNSFENTWITDSCSWGGERLPDIYWKNHTGGTTPNSNDYWHREDYTGTDWATPATGAYTPAASNGSHSARFHNDPPPAGSTGALDFYVNMGMFGKKQITFDYIHNEASPAPFAMNVMLSTDGGSTFPTTLLTISSAQVAAWTTQTISTTAISSTAVLRFIVTDKGTQDVGIDNLKISVLRDTIAPTTTVTAPAAWETANFTQGFTDADNAGGSGVEKSFYQAIYFDGTQWGANTAHGFFAHNFSGALHPNWTIKTGTWVSGSNALVQSDTSLGNTNIYAPLTQNLSNRYLYSFNATIGGTGTNRRAGFHFCCDRGDSSNRNNSYFVWFRADLSEMDIYKVVNNTFTTPVYTVPATIHPNQSYNYVVIYDRITGLIRVYQNNVLLGSWTDPSPYANGSYVSFRSGNATLSVSQFRAYRSRTNSGTVNITVGAASTNDLMFQNSNPTTPAAHINSICSDSAANLSAVTSQPVNIDWTKPTHLSNVYNGTAANHDTSCYTTQLSANWSTAVDSNSAIAYYSYAIGTTPGAQNIVAWTNNGTATAVTRTGLSLTVGQTYYVSVKAVDGAGLACDSVNGQGVIVLNCSTGIQEAAGKEVFKLYPNPSSGVVQLELPQLTGTFHVAVWNALGQQVWSEQVVPGTVTLPLSDLAAGMYQLSVSQEGKRLYIQKLILRK
jgi:GH25 family lysozyme M1 (1,4-beta-N-acetylmuramidase)